MWWALLIVVILLIIDVVLLYYTREPKNLTDVKQRYRILTDYIINNPEVPEKFHCLRDPIIITGRRFIANGDIGYNTNKGLEIGVCIGLNADADPNDIFHVLLHELSHSTVAEFDHSKQFWSNFAELKDICVKLGIYTKIVDRKSFCGKYIVD